MLFIIVVWYNFAHKVLLNGYSTVEHFSIVAYIREHCAIAISWKLVLIYYMYMKWVDGMWMNRCFAFTQAKGVLFAL